MLRLLVHSTLLSFPADGVKRGYPPPLASGAARQASCSFLSWLKSGKPDALVRSSSAQFCVNRAREFRERIAIWKANADEAHLCLSCLVFIKIQRSSCLQKTAAAPASPFSLFCLHSEPDCLFLFLFFIGLVLRVLHLKGLCWDSCHTPAESQVCMTHCGWVGAY